MLINEVEHTVGLSKKSIRFYEEHGLLSPKRNETNAYRVYDEEDVAKLKLIKFLRELGVSIKDLESLNDGTLTLEECMDERIKKITVEEEKFSKVKDMCTSIAQSHENFDNIDITKYFEDMNVLGKEGFTLRDVKKSKTKKIMGACLSTAVFGLLFILIPAVISYFQFTEAEKMPWIIYFILMAILMIPFVGMITNLIIRIKEINGGEEDEASKY
ncbi:MAG TPA: hypothetical protein DCY94_02130 [Firmicutes bacterium]|nr:hypothetical protein [Bacillota bacterium]